MAAGKAAEEGSGGESHDQSSKDASTPTTAPAVEAGTSGHGHGGGEGSPSDYSATSPLGYDVHQHLGGAPAFYLPPSGYPESAGSSTSSDDGRTQSRDGFKVPSLPSRSRPTSSAATSPVATSAERMYATSQQGIHPHLEYDSRSRYGIRTDPSSAPATTSEFPNLNTPYSSNPSYRARPGAG